jgi:membrane-bound ClpP family serine protease
MMEDVETVANEVTLLALLALLQFSILMGKPHIKMSLFRPITFGLILAAVLVAGFAFHKIYKAKKKIQHEPVTVFERKEVKKEETPPKEKHKKRIIIEEERKR